MKVVVDYDICASTGSCMQVCPEVFEVRSDGYLYVLQEEPGEELRTKVDRGRRPLPDGRHHRRGIASPMGFHDRLAKAWSTSGSMLCVGLDPDPAAFPEPLDGLRAIERFCIAIVDATADLVCAFKPQFAHFAAQRAEPQLEAVCRYIRETYPDVVVVLDAKRGDVGSTAEHYAREAFGRYAADAVTVNPYLGTDAAAPFLAAGGVLALCHTSNPGSAELQDLDVGGVPLFERVATMVATRWSELGEAGLVVGATFPGQLARARELVGELPILVPGVGAQGGDLEASVRAGSVGPGTGLLLSCVALGAVRVGRRRLRRRRARRRAGDPRRHQRGDDRGLIAPSSVPVRQHRRWMSLVLVLAAACSSDDDPPAATPDPLAIVADVEPGAEWVMWLGQPMPDPSSWPPLDAEEAALVSFARGLGGVDDATSVRLTIEGRSARTVSVTQARAEVECAAPDPAAAFVDPPRGRVRRTRSCTGTSTSRAAIRSSTSCCRSTRPVSHGSPPTR